MLLVIIVKEVEVNMIFDWKGLNSFFFLTFVWFNFVLGFRYLDFNHVYVTFGLYAVFGTDLSKVNPDTPVKIDKSWIDERWVL